MVGPGSISPRRREELAIEYCRRVGAFDAVAACLWRHARAFVVAGAAFAVFFAADVAIGYRAASPASGTRVERALFAAVSIRRDARFVPHIAAANAHDLFFAQGFADASDRLFQMDLERRYALGTLAEVFGPRALAIDERQRYYDVREVASREWSAMDGSDRAAVSAYTAGVNAAMSQQSLPVEYRVLMAQPAPWRAQDCLAVSLAVSIALSDSWEDVLQRDAVWRRVGPRAFDQYVPLSDPRYDVSIGGRPDRPRRAPNQRAWPRMVASAGVHLAAVRPGSNAWAAGGARTAGGRALLANDPHLDLTIPGLWHLVDLRAPGVHVAGASIPGAPGVLLGHNEHVAWAATNADTAAMSVYETGTLDARGWVSETFHVRYAADVVRPYFRTADVFAVPDDAAPSHLALVRWPSFQRTFARASAIHTFLALDRARDLRGALAVLSTYAGTAENLLLADTNGAVTYHLAGGVPDDAAWGRYVHPSRDLARAAPLLRFAALPSAPRSRSGVVVSANNRMYGRGYPYRLAATFDPPYRAYRVAQMLRARRRYDAAYFAAMQLDVVSPADLEFAHDVATDIAKIDAPGARALAARLERWNGAFVPQSRTATLVHALRDAMLAGEPSLYALLAQFRAGEPPRDFDTAARGALYDAREGVAPWSRAGAVTIEHPLAPLQLGFLNGAALPGDGNEYTVHLQEDGFSQSFRAVWDVGNWDAGGISIPSGESGEPGSGHYRDLTAAWIAGRLEPLPFSDAAVKRGTRETLTLLPANR